MIGHASLRLPVIVTIIVAMVMGPLVASLEAQLIVEEPPKALKNVDIVEKLGESIPLDLEFIGEDGGKVRLGDCLAPEKPLVLILAYYQCPKLCSLVLNGLARTVKKLDWEPGKQYNIVTVSIDPTEKPKLAREKKDNYMADLGKGAKDGWRFLCSEEKPVKTLADGVGFKYYYDEEKEIYAHAAAVFIITDGGRISRYLYGFNFRAKDLRLALLEASQGKIGTIVDRIILFCNRYDPSKNRYTLMASRVMQIGGVLTILALGTFLGVLWLAEFRRRGRLEVKPSG